MGPPLHIDRNANRLFTMAVKEAPVGAGGTGGTAGVVEIDLASSSANPFVAFHPLSRDGEGGCYLNTCRSNSVVSSTISNVSKVGTKWYVYNYVSGVDSTSLPDSRNKLLCFDLATKSACANQPYDVTRPAGVQGRLWHPPTIAAISNRIFISIYGTSDAFSLAGYSCVDVSSTPANCTGWPIVPAAQFAGSTFTMAPPFPRLNSSGGPIGVCFAGNPTNACTDFAGQTATTGSNLQGLAAPFNVDWATTRGEAYVEGTRMFMPNVVLANGTSEVECYDFATDTLCANFPQAGVAQAKTFPLSQMEAVYTIQTDPSDPSCLWLMGHGGSRQIQNFDAETGGLCGANGFVMSISSFREDLSRCAATAWKQFTLVSPTVGNFTSGTLEFADSNGAAISGLNSQSFGSSGTLDLTSLNLHSYPSLARLRVRLQGSTATAISVKMRWASEYHPECVVSGQTAFTVTTTTTAAPTSTTTSAPTTTPPSAPLDASGAETLPATGTTNSSMLAWAVLLLAMGALTIIAGHRGRTAGQ
jgi:LPXTG-motif cell wall-anchored protein